MNDLLKYANLDKSEQPQPGDERYNRQVETIFKVCSSADNYKMAEQMSLMYVLDMSYHRAAICEALKKLEKHFNEK